MQSPQDSHATEELARLIESARRLGVELKEAEALQWLTAMAVHNDHDVVIDESSGVFGHRVSMLDFSPQELAHFRQIGRIVEFDDEPGVVETALALSGSAAQSKIQSYPGDCDYFERVNIIAPSRAEACRILSRIMRAKALSMAKGSTYQLLEVKFGSYPTDVMRDGHTLKADSPIAWTAQEIATGQIEVATPDGAPLLLHWDDVAANPGWCKLDWIVADPLRGQLANASNMLDVTWEGPDGDIIPLDGYLDPYFQEVYLDAQSVPIFSKLVKHVSADALEQYVAQLEHEVHKYLTKDINYGKVAKRMYNIFRLTGRYYEAAFLRELFDEPATILYQVWSLIRTLDDTTKPGATIPIQNVLAQTDQLIIEAVKALEGEQEEEIVRNLLHLRNSLTRQRSGQELIPEAEAARAEVINLVNNFYYQKLSGVASIKAYMEQMQK